MHRHRIVAMLSLGLGLVAGGCSRATGGGSEDRTTVYQTDATVTVRIVNRSQLDAAIYLLHDGARDRLGTVTAASTASFTVRARTLGSGDFALFADPVGVLQGTSTERLHVGQGTEFVWTIEADFSRSEVLVRD